MAQELKVPNIEVYGYRLPHKDLTLNPAGAKLISGMWSVLADAPYREEVVITAIDSTISNDPINGFPEAQTFVRVWASEQEVVNDIVRRLHVLDIDIELPPLLSKFIPKRSAKT